VSTIGTRLGSTVPVATSLQIIWATMPSLATMASLAFAPHHSVQRRGGGVRPRPAQRGDPVSCAGPPGGLLRRRRHQLAPINAQDDIAFYWVNRFGFRREAVLSQ